MVRQQLLQSGLSQSEIRSRLAAAGLPADALDQFLSGNSIDGATAFDDNALSALEGLGITVGAVDGLEFVPVTTGLQQGITQRQILVNGLPIFGLDIFTHFSHPFNFSSKRCPLLWIESMGQSTNDEVHIVVNIVIKCDELIIPHDSFCYPR